MSDKKCMLLFIKFPEKGTVKSRLAKDIHEDSALSLYRNLVLDILKTLETGKYQLKLCFYPPDALDKFSAWLGKGYAYMPQKGKDLGERMKNAFRETFSQGFAKVLLIGSDIPDLTRTIINEAYEFDNYDAVIGPSLDGGYYLIGFKHDTFSPEIFEGCTGAQTGYSGIQWRYFVRRCTEFISCVKKGILTRLKICGHSSNITETEASQIQERWRLSGIIGINFLERRKIISAYIIFCHHPCFQ